MRPPEQLAPLVSPYTGIVQTLVEYLHAPEDARLPSVGSLLARGEPVLGVRTVEHGGGSHESLAEAAAAAVGEAVERYAAAYRPSGLAFGSADRLPDAVDPARFALFHERQHAEPAFPFHRFTAATRLVWAEGRSLADRSRALLPAQLVYLGRPAPGEPPIATPTSNGVACGTSREEATLRGLLELVERDAVMIVWYGRLSLPLLTWDDAPEVVAFHRRYFARAGLVHAAVDLSAFFGIPAVLGVVRGPRDDPGALGVGAGCAPTVEEAWRKALTEAYSVRRWARALGIERPERPRGPGDIRDFDDHILAYVDVQRARAADFLVASARRRPISDVPPLPGTGPAERLAAAVDRLAGHGVGAYAVDVTSPDVRSAGLHVIRAVAPELCPLDVLGGARYLGGERLYRAAHEAGLADAPLEFEDVNPDPHPFP